MGNLPICCWAAEDIPAIKGKRLGFDALTNAELLSIVIGSGTRDCNAIETSRIILNRCNNNLGALSRMKEHELSDIKGLGRQKLSRIQACMELAARRITDFEDVKPDLGTPTRAYNHFRHLADNDTEEFWVAYLNQRYKLIKDVRISHGGLTEVLVDYRIIMREAVLCNSTVMVAVHNHPSNDPKPSTQDDSLTRGLKKASDIMHIHLLDHIIIADGHYYSYHEEGKL